MSKWSETTNVDNALAVAAHAANTRLKHTIRGFSASYEVATDSGLCQVKLGAVVVFEHFVQPGESLQLPFALTAAVNEAVSIELAASGTPTNLGYVNIWGDDGGTTLIPGR